MPRLFTKTSNRNCELQKNCILFFCSDLPDKPSSVTISVASEDSLLVRFIEPLSEKVVVSKYKSEYKKLISNCTFLKFNPPFCYKMSLITSNSDEIPTFLAVG